MSRNGLVLITRLSTANVGNEGLSFELALLFQKLAGARPFAVVDRLPNYMLRYRLEDYPREPDQAVLRFEADAAALAELCRSAKTPAARFEIDWPRLRFSPQRHRLVVALKQILAVRRRLSQMQQRKLWEDFLKRIALYKESAWVILNPAGELAPESLSSPLPLLLELRVAQLLGCRIATVNHSLEVTHPVLKAILAHCYRQFDLIRVRDSYSLGVLQAMQCAEDRIGLIPDACWRTEPVGTGLPAPAIPQGSIGLAINAKVGEHRAEAWAALLRDLIRETGREVYFVTNALSTDLRFARYLQRQAAIKVLSPQQSYRTYAGQLGGLDLVISNRLHTTLFSLAAGTPVVAVEPLHSKLRGVLEQAGYPIPVVSTESPRWREEVLEGAMSLLRAPKPRADVVNSWVAPQSLKVEEGFREFFRLLDRA